MIAETKTMPLSELIPADYNPRTITPEAREALRESIRIFGQASSLTFNQRTGNLIGGHQRAAIMLEEGLKEAIVSIVDLPIEDEKALNIALNSQKLAGRFDDQKLYELLQEIKNSESDVFLQLRMNEMLPRLENGDIREEILSETEYQALQVDVEAIIFSLSEKIRKIAENYPDRLSNAISLILPLHGGRQFLLLIDKNTTQAAAELIRYAEAEQSSPLDCLLSSILTFKKS